MQFIKPGTDCRVLYRISAPLFLRAAAFGRKQRLAVRLYSQHQMSGYSRNRVVKAAGADSGHGREEWKEWLALSCQKEGNAEPASKANLQWKRLALQPGTGAL